MNMLFNLPKYLVKFKDQSVTYCTLYIRFDQCISYFQCVSGTYVSFGFGSVSSRLNKKFKNLYVYV